MRLGRVLNAPPVFPGSDTLYQDVAPAYFVLSRKLATRYARVHFSAEEAVTDPTLSTYILNRHREAVDAIYASGHNIIATNYHTVPTSAAWLTANGGVTWVDKQRPPLALATTAAQKHALFMNEIYAYWVSIGGDPDGFAITMHNEPDGQGVGFPQALWSEIVGNVGYILAGWYDTTADWLFWEGEGYIAAPAQPITGFHNFMEVYVPAFLAVLHPSIRVFHPQCSCNNMTNTANTALDESFTWHQEERFTTGGNPNVPYSAYDNDWTGFYALTDEAGAQLMADRVALRDSQIRGIYGANSNTACLEWGVQDSWPSASGAFNRKQSFLKNGRMVLLASDMIEAQGIDAGFFCPVSWESPVDPYALVKADGTPKVMALPFLARAGYAEATSDTDMNGNTFELSVGDAHVSTE